jgi:adenine phosphoribosyltransferase
MAIPSSIRQSKEEGTGFAHCADPVPFDKVGRAMSIDLKSYILDVADFPKPGIVFKDITPIVQSAQAFHFAVDELAAWARPCRPEIVAGIESRGFLFAAALARELRLGMTVIRKKGKLPRKAVSVVAPNEYAVEHFEMHEDGVAAGQRVLIIDDLIATGSSSVSAINLVKLLKGDVVGFGAVVELSFLGGVELIRRTHPEVEVRALVRY